MDSSMTDQQILSTSPMKQSVSLTSLPPPTSHGTADVSDSSVAKIFIERPYNSLKVCNKIVFFCDFLRCRRKKAGQSQKIVVLERKICE